MNRRLGPFWMHLQHGLLILLVVWLLATSPWVHLYNRIPASPTLWVWGHLILGVLALLVSVSFSLSCLVQGRLRQYFPWAFGQVRPLLGDLAGLFRLRIPGNEGGGLFSVIKGFLLISLLAVALTGLMWLWTAGSRDAVAWRGWHLDSVRVMGVFLALHVLATVAHLVQFIRQ